MCVCVPCTCGFGRGVGGLLEEVAVFGGCVAVSCVVGAAGVGAGAGEEAEELPWGITQEMKNEILAPLFVSISGNV